MSHQKRTSSVWKHFKDVGGFMAVCNICRQTYSYKTSISNLKKHYRLKHKRFIISNKEQSRPFDTEENTETFGAESIASDNADENVRAPTADKTTQEAAQPSTSSAAGIKRKAEFVFPRKYNRQKRMAFQLNRNPNVGEWKNTSAQISNRIIKDDSSAYGDYIASKHRKYSEHTKSMIEHLIAEILFKADMGRYETDATSDIDAAASSNGDNTQEAETLYDSGIIKHEMQDPLIAESLEIM